ncbi:MAG: ABC transporter substrate-binding protein [Desulfobacula sp.]|nr:ABC transporter substrate-binding protein [Desulfobacula sp.]
MAILFSINEVSGDDTIDIAVIYAITGAAAKNNSYSLKGIYHGVQEINDAGGVLDKKINILVFDNQSTPIGSHMAAIKAVQSGAVAILGAAWSSHSLVIAQIAQKGKIPMITNISTNPDVTKNKDYVFRICFNDTFQGRVLAKFARQDLKALTAVMFVNVASDYSLKLSELFRSNFEYLGGKVIQELEYKLKQMVSEQAIQQAVDSKVDVVFIPGHDESGSIARNLQAKGSRSVFLGGDGWASPVFLSKGGRELNRGYYCTHWSAQMNTRESNVFKKRYIQSESSAANIALGYDAIQLLADAITRSGSFDREKIRKSLADTKQFKGVTGRIRFDEEGDPVKNAVFMEIRKGRPFFLKVLSP